MSNVEAIKKAYPGHVFISFIETKDEMLDVFSPFRFRKWNVKPFEGGVEYVLASTLEAFQRENEELKRHVEELQEKISPEKDCACSYDEAGAVCAAHSPMLKVAEAEVKRLRDDRRMLVSHATMGRTDGEGQSVNDICVTITKLRNELYEEARKSALASAGEEHHAE